MIKSELSSKNTLLKILVILFICIYAYFASFSFRFSYIGVNADHKDGTWIIKNIHTSGAAHSSPLSIGDEILKIDERPTTDNFLLNKMLLVEQADSLTVKHKNKKIKLSFGNNTKKIDFFIFSILSFILLFLSYIFFKRHEISRISQRYYIFLFLTALFLIAIIPSSMGNIVARALLIFYVTIFPLFIDMFWRATNLTTRVVKLSRLAKISCGYSFVTLILFISSCFMSVPLYVTKYLSIYIFYISLIFLLLSLLSAFYTNLKKKTLNKLNLIFALILGVTPLFVGYIFPSNNEVPVLYTIPLMIFPIIAVINSLITNRFTNIRLHLPSFWIYFLISLVITSDALCLFLMTNYLPNELIITYTFLFVLNSLPLLKELFMITSKKEYRLIDNTSIFSAIEAEREDISIYLHDTIIQDVIYHKRQLDELAFVSRPKLQEILDDIIFELRELCSNIYPLMIKELGLKNAILDVIDKFQKKELVTITCQIEVTKFDFKNELNNFILRSIREIINNSVIHSNAKNITVYIHEVQEAIIIEIIDDGQFSNSTKTTSPHFGLNVIAEKLFLLGGKLVITTAPTTVKMFIPKDNRSA